MHSPLFTRLIDNDVWQEFAQSFHSELAPKGPIELTVAAEIIGAAWRLRNCNLAEAASDQNPDHLDKARNQAQRHFQSNLAELRRLQTERQFRNEYFPESTDTSQIGVASVREIIPVLQKIATTDPVKQEMFAFDALKRAASDPNWVRSAKSAQTPRNALCPCGSGTKYKRCCGINAPAILGQAA